MSVIFVEQDGNAAGFHGDQKHELKSMALARCSVFTGLVALPNSLPRKRERREIKNKGKSANQRVGVASHLKSTSCQASPSSQFGKRDETAKQSVG